MFLAMGVVFVIYTTCPVEIESLEKMPDSYKKTFCESRRDITTYAGCAILILAVVGLIIKKTQSAKLKYDKLNNFQNKKEI